MTALRRDSVDTRRHLSTTYLVVVVALLVAACSPGSRASPSSPPTTPAAPTVLLAPGPTATATAHSGPSATAPGAPYEDAFSNAGDYTTPDPLPLRAGASYLVDWTYGGDGVCAFQAGLQATGNATGVRFARSASDGDPMGGKSTITWSAENGADPRLVVVSDCLWVVTIREVRA